MSYAFDTLNRAWESLRKQLPPAHSDGELAMRFSYLLEEMHDANHRLGDAVNKDAAVTAYARKLDACIDRATGGAT